VTIRRDRAPYSAIVDRPPLPALPGGHRIVVWTIVNVEVWDIARLMPRTVLAPPAGQALLPDVANWSWHEYGMRVGFWRFFSLYNRLGITPTLAMNGRVCLDYPRGDGGEVGMGVDGAQLRAGADPKVGLYTNTPAFSSGRPSGRPGFRT
jgi:hypothetical protein